MMPGIDAVNTLKPCLLAEILCELFCNAVDTAYGRYNPYLITYTYITVLTFVGLEGTVLLCNAQFLANGLIGVFESA